MTSENRVESGISECCSVNRRSFVKAVAAASSLAMLPGRTFAAGLFAGPSRTSASETAVAEFYASLTDDQKKVLCFDFEHELRHRISANWHVTKPTMGETFFTSPQREMVGRIVKGLCSEEGYERMTRQMDEDAGGLHEFSVAMFGEPGSKQFEFMLTGRHLTLRADGDSVDKAAFGGPIVYGHDQIEKDASKNIYFYQTQQTDAVFKSLTSEQAAKALLEKAPAETAVQLQGESGKFAGIKVGDLQADQKAMVETQLEHAPTPGPSGRRYPKRRHLKPGQRHRAWTHPVFDGLRFCRSETHRQKLPPLPPLPPSPPSLGPPTP